MMKVLTAIRFGIIRKTRFVLLTGNDKALDVIWDALQTAEAKITANMAKKEENDKKRGHEKRSEGRNK